MPAHTLDGGFPDPSDVGHPNLPRRSCAFVPR
jgi:hypothetical protein